MPSILRNRIARRVAGLAAVLVACVSTLAATMPAAQALPLTPMEACRANAWTPYSWTYTQHGGTVGVSYPVGPNPPNGIFPGDVIRVSIVETSTVSISFWNTEWYGVDGKSEQASAEYPFPGWPKYGNFYRFNNNPGGWVASGQDPNPYNPHPLRELAVCTYAPNIPVRWGTQINDPKLDDNSGSWKFTLNIWR